MESLTNTSEAIQKLCAFLQQSEKSTSKGDDIESLFIPPKDNKVVSVEVEIAFLDAPPAHRVPLYFVLPHDVSFGTICLITPPPQRAFKNKILALTEKGDATAQRVKRVIDTTKLNAKIVDPVVVRAFAKSYDNFVVYGAHRYPKQLSGEFLGHQKMPVWVAKKGGFESSLHNAAKTAAVSRRGENAATCRVGHTGLSVEELKENVEMLIEKFTHHPQGTPLKHVLHIRVAGTNADGKRAGLTIFSHEFQFPATEAGPAAKKSKTE